MKPIFDALSSYKQKNNMRLHMPGHSGCSAVLGCFSDVLPYDITEIDGMDSLYDADGIIKQSEDYAAQVYGSGAVLYSAGGCTLAINAMLATFLKPGDGVLCMRASHRSFINTAALLDLRPVWLYGDVTPESVGAALSENMSAGQSPVRAVYVTSPDYYGRLLDIEKIASACHRFGLPLLVDAAHGGHLRFLSKNLDPVSLGADACALSLHKTLPVLTGGAVLSLKDGRLKSRAKSAMALFGSTSPSYPILASLELAVNWAAENGRTEFARLEQTVDEIKKLITDIDMLPCGRFDPVRLTLHTARAGVDGGSAARMLINKGIYPDYYDGQFVVMIPTPFTEDFERLKGALSDLKSLSRTFDGRQANAFEAFAAEKLSNQDMPALTPRQAMLSEYELVETAKSVGRIAAETASLCPPGIPLVTPGEPISKKTAEFILNSGKKYIKVIK